MINPVLALSHLKVSEIDRDKEREIERERERERETETERGGELNFVKTN